MVSVSLMAHGTYVLVACAGIIGTLEAIRRAALGVRTLKIVATGQGGDDTAELVPFPTVPTTLRKAA